MTMLWFSLPLLVIFSAQTASAEVCEDEINHLKEFGVHHIPKPTTPNSNFIYKDIAGSNMVLAIPKEDSARWKLDTSSTKNGYAFSARGMMVGISGEFDKTGKCVNATTFDYDVMTNELPKNVANMILTFNYNFQVCQKVESIVSRNGIKFNNSDTAVDEIKKKRLADYNELQKLTQTAVENKFYKIARPSVSLLLTKCMTAIGNRSATSLLSGPAMPPSAPSGSKKNGTNR